MLLGVDYYPEQWNIDLMEQDMDTIVKMGCNVIRIAEFSWHMMEKREGQFDFSTVTKVLDAMEEAGIDVIIGTPTYAVPSWLVKMDPTVLAVTHH